ncbi:MAG: molybdate ABC transporter substrate-binding protein [Alphaproteobacteria bacterium]|nr:molybdate ABC transporter substrate-binding protein [Alphaproteobacteria bacterium]MBU0797422.1 molybdate ABC transporter substrate-binding protein [Alphaproteobacteria bacterium]MBU0888541.1 molybdate ABC transporter substrate-binding protein [Alphaproteobacteria bacterium]MBU1813725.1 molybdate ABC transporter substrate-binding protein [Alphaproteobacteria bacterium]
MRFRMILTALILLVVAASQPAMAQGKPVTVFAAASLKTALDEVMDAWSRESGKQARVSYAGSSALARQIEQGAPADLFISADIDWMDYLEQHKLIRAETRGNLLGNSIVLIASGAHAPAVAITPGFPLASLLKGGRLAMAETSAVPAGKYGKAALESLGVWTSVADRLAQAENVRAALLLVSRGEAPYGIVYATDAAADPKVSVVGTFPAGSHPPILYPAAILAGSKNPDAAAFLAHVKSPKMKPVFEKQGFTVLGQ